MFHILFAVEKEIEGFSEIAGIDWLITFDQNDNFIIKKFDKYPVKNELITKFYKRNVPGLIVFTSGSTGKPKGIFQLRKCDEKIC